MIGMAQWCLSLLLAIGPNHHLLTHAVAASDIVEVRIMPWSRMIEGAGPLWLAFHDQQGAPLAAYLPPPEDAASADAAGELADPQSMPPAPDDVSAWKIHSAADAMVARAWFATLPERFLPELRVPRLVLSKPAFVGSSASGESVDRLAPLEGLPIDAVESLSRALAEAWLTRLPEADPQAAAWLEARARELMAEVPREQRTRVYVSALLDFHAHALSIAHEIGRQSRRQAARGRLPQLCAQMEAGQGLFLLWRQALGETRYFGYRDPDPSALSAADGSRTRAVLEAEDKRWWTEQLGRSWSGEPRDDFGFLCR